MTFKHDRAELELKFFISKHWGVNETFGFNNLKIIYCDGGSICVDNNAKFE